ncbi:DUF2206 domain-containing protein [Methanobacterium oryzae]|uniref:DUF2206 domain-containing protein n=1 Tax=Methanobacterium oryzae TaxID=69540 RepID=UPI003D2296F8
MIKDIINLDNKKWLLDFQNLGIKNLIIVLFTMLMITDIAIILNIPFLREFMTIISLTTIPGTLILLILRLHQLEFIKKIVLLVGLSLTFLMFMGFVLNILYPFIEEPLSLKPVLVSLNIILIAFAFIAYRINKNALQTNFLNFKISLNDKLRFPFIIPILFPLMAIIGTYLMNTTQNNIILLIMLFFIPLYIILIAFLKNKVHEVVYPFSIWMIGLSLLLMHGLTSNYLMGRDVHYEFYCFQLTLQNFHWDINAYLNPYNACLGITVLPTIFKVLSNIGSDYVFKIFFSFIGSFIPLVVYAVSKKYIDSKYAFFASLLFTFQIFFVYLLGAVRQEIAILFFFLAIMVLFTDKINNLNKKILFIVLLASIMVSHYTTAYISFVLVLPILAFPFLKALFIERKFKFTNFDVIVISALFILLWYVLFADVQANAGSQVVQTTIASSASSASSFADNKGDYVLGILGIKLKSLPNTVSVIVHDLIFLTIGIGLLTIIRNYREYLKKIDPEYIIAILVSIVLLVLFIVLPYISIAYDAARLFFQLLIFLAPVFVIGAIRIAKAIKKPNMDVVILVVLLISLFSCATYLQYHFMGMPYSPDYEKDGLIRNEAFMYNQEIIGAEWLKNNQIGNLTMYSDGRELLVFFRAYGKDIKGIQLNNTYFHYNNTINDRYLYLGHLNVNGGKIQELYTHLEYQDIKNYSNLFSGKDKIYENGGSQIWR